jgi:hypothetical protein
MMEGFDLAMQKACAGSPGCLLKNTMGKCDFLV